MTIRVRSPLAEIATPEKGRALRRLEVLEGGRLGLLWSQHASSAKFWPVLEKIAAEVYAPSEVHRLYKDSTWNVAPPEQVRDLAGKVDYVLVGVGG
jgi:hypothetical protein